MNPNKRPAIAPSIDDARLRPHLRERARLERRQAELFRGEYARAQDEGKDVARPTRRVVTIMEPGDLRGIPVLAKGVGGTQPGTNPTTVTQGRRGEWSPRRAA